ncbi:cytochrome c oxidase subunit 3 [Lacimicrobium alkaliphilum]|uniref:Cytochrome c oxidase subunit III n=1 Tax=Lacimicrobium alkaliphilum TaxID=1526571 RepID=A0A0U2ZGP0_9ALTE|nr:cytochrome c oxidase subunit 3 [Lacimicrobium alkaliphilum]ALS97628.1 cytochrome c oxidase subunit III [Lacimicrobium alkaliphilum]
MSIFQTLTEKPWLEGTNEIQQKSPDRVKKSAVKVLLSVISVLFFLFFVAFLMRSQYPDWRPLAEEPGQPLFYRGQLWLNTLYLILSSLCFHWASRAVKHNNAKSVQVGILIGGLFAAAFIGGQLVFWQQLQAQGFFVNHSPALSFFYLFTGLHIAHLLGGMIAWAMALFSLKKAGNGSLVSLCATYWHYLLVLWALLFALLVSKPETYDAIAAFCGLGQ